MSQAQIKALRAKLKAKETEIGRTSDLLDRVQESAQSIQSALRAGGFSNRAERTAFEAGLRKKQVRVARLGEELRKLRRQSESIERQIEALREQRAAARRTRAAMPGREAARQYKEVADMAYPIIMRADWARGTYSFEELANAVAAAWFEGTDRYPPQSWPVDREQIGHYINAVRKDLSKSVQSVSVEPFSRRRRKKAEEEAARQSGVVDVYADLDAFLDTNPLGSLLALHVGKIVVPGQPAALKYRPRAKSGPRYDLAHYHLEGRLGQCPTCARIYRFVNLPDVSSPEEVTDIIDRLIPEYAAFRGA